MQRKSLLGRCASAFSLILAIHILAYPLGAFAEVASALNTAYPPKPAVTDGSSDTDPVTRPKEQWHDNWDLSYALAKVVTQYLTAHGVDQKLVSIIANGSNKPKGSKPASRRVEIVVHAK